MSKAVIGLLIVVVAAVGAVAFGAVQASASSAPIVFAYHKKCDASNHCVGTAGNGGSIEMQVDPASFRPTGKAAHLTLTEWVTVGGISFTAVMNGTFSPDGFIVLNGTVTDGAFEGARVHQRSNFAGVDAGKTVWDGELQLMPASA